MIGKSALTFLVLIIALISLFLQLHFAAKNQLPLTIHDDQCPDAYAKTADLLQMNKNGLPELRLRSPLLTYYQKSGALDMIEPNITFYQIDSPPWSINASKGKAINKLETIYLWDQVRAKQTAGVNNSSTTLLTSQMTLFRLKKILFTDQHITLIQPGLQMQAIGAQADMKTRKITLSSHAQAYYDPTQGK